MSMNREICSNCGTVGFPKYVIKGNVLIEIILWLCFLIPGLIYSIWSRTNEKKSCRACGSQNLVPLNSPVGKKLQNEFGDESTHSAITSPDSGLIESQLALRKSQIGFATALAIVFFILVAMTALIDLKP